MFHNMIEKVVLTIQDVKHRCITFFVKLLVCHPVLQSTVGLYNCVTIADFSRREQ